MSFNTNCYSKCRIANFEFTIACPEFISGVNADRPIKQQIEQPVPKNRESENMRHFIG